MLRQNRSDSPDEERDAAANYTPAARVASLAEAGYLVSVLQGEGLDAEVRHTKSFSAINGAWLTDYVVAAPAEQLPQVAEVLRAEAAAFEDETDFGEEDDETLQQVVWRPVALMAFAGFVSFIAGQHFATAPPRGGQPGLADAVSGVGKPFYTTPGPDGTRHRLFLDTESAQWLLDVDHDGDGRFDERRRFSTENRAMALGR